MKLAPELRNRIYEYVVIYEEAIDFVEIFEDVDEQGSGHYGSCIEAVLGNIEQRVKQPALTRASRVLRTETLPMFYAFNTFRGSLLDRAFSDTEATWRWLLAIGRWRTMLKNFTVEWYHDPEVCELAFTGIPFRREVLAMKPVLEELIEFSDNV